MPVTRPPVQSRTCSFPASGSSVGWCFTGVDAMGEMLPKIEAISYTIHTCDIPSRREPRTRWRLSVHSLVLATVHHHVRTIDPTRRRTGHKHHSPRHLFWAAVASQRERVQHARVAFGVARLHPLPHAPGELDRPQGHHVHADPFPAPHLAQLPRVGAHRGFPGAIRAGTVE